MAGRRKLEHEPVSHAVAHYLVAIADLKDEYGYARVSDVARAIGITRGSASITLKSLKQKGLVVEDDRRFLGLSDVGQQVADSIRVKKELMRRLFTVLLGVAEKQAEEDTCRIEHLISAETAAKVAHLLDYMQKDDRTVRAFIKGARSGGKSR